MLTGGQLAALIVAVFWAILVCALSYVLLRLARVLTEATKLVAGVTDRTVPLLDEITTTVTHVDGQLERMDSITRNVESVTGSAAKLGTLVTAIVGRPMARMAGLAYGMRKTVGERERGELQRRVRTEVQAVRRQRRRGRRGVRS